MIAHSDCLMVSNFHEHRILEKCMSCVTATSSQWVSPAHHELHQDASEEGSMQKGHATIENVAHMRL